ncbi:uncharacterized protein TNCV_4965331 [Trichonephila clavipes]|nr:uncharacterized protein TNCV_4965331 [Trichonephila clavipes]
MTKSKFKAILIVFFDINGIVKLKWVPCGENVNQHYYIEVLKRLREKIRKKGHSCGMMAALEETLHQDNVSAYTVLSVKKFLTRKNITMMGNSPHSTDLVP